MQAVEYVVEYTDQGHWCKNHNHDLIETLQVEHDIIKIDMQLSEADLL